MREHTANGSYLLNLDQARIPAWIRVDLATTGESAREWMLDTNNSFGGRMTLYVVVDGELRQRLEVDSYRSFHTRPYDHREVVFSISLPPDSRAQLLLYMEKMQVSLFSLTLSPQQQFLSDERRDGWLEGILLGMMLSMIIYHLIIAIATLDRIYLLYSAFIGPQRIWLSVPLARTALD